MHYDCFYEAIIRSRRVQFNSVRQGRWLTQRPLSSPERCFQKAGWTTQGPARIPPAGNLHPARGHFRPARGNLRPARGENLPEVTLGALFHGYSHVLREVPSGSPALDKVPRRTTMSGHAVTHKLQWIHQQSPTKWTKHTLKVSL